MKSVDVADLSRVLLAPARFEPMASAEPAPVAGVASTISLKHLGSILRRRIGWLVLAMLLGLAASLAFVATSAPRYISTAQIIIDPRGLKVLDTEVQPSAQSADAVSNLVESEMRVLKATDLLERVVDKLKLADDPEFNGTRTSLVGDVVGGIKGVFAQFTTRRWKAAPDLRARAVANLSDRLAVRRIERSFVVEITMMSEDAEKSARIANTLVDTYIARSAETQADLARKSSAAINGNIDQMQARVRDAEDAVERFKTSNKLVNAGGRLLSDQQLGDLSAQLGRARTQVAEAQARVDQLSKVSRGMGAGLESVESSTIAALRVQLAEVKRRYASLENKLGPRHPELVDLRREVQEAQNNINAEIGRLAQAARNDLERAREAERLFKRDIDAQSRTATVASNAFVQLRELERKAEASRSVYSAALVRSRQLQEQALLNSTNIRKVAPAAAPDRPSNPAPSLVLALGLIGGLVVGAGGLTVLDLTVGKVRNRDDLEQSSHLPIFGSVPVAAKALHPGVANLYRTDARPWLEMIDRLGIGRQGGPRSVAVLSADVNDMSGLVALDLARAAASIGAKVLLIDAAVGMRHLTGFLGLDDAAGLGACAAGQITLEDAVWPIQEDGITFLPGDAHASNDLRRIGGLGLSGIVRQALGEYALVVLDFGSAPRESLALVAAGADAGILVVEKERGRKSAVQSALSLCQAARLSLAGLVLATPVDPKGRGA
ncbi:GumC family protein [Methylobacterium sp. J-068]|uniref:GumC family protein n=1 Tax=Methylobacterium sp. J-068 TaxID=2836649 RepID=UPI001FBC08CE|nr:exopolysaccharide transport family protein [Methylobacterium sp. J-068]MCJ2033488.1 exopolysaccharide transport family protein [Methylobacterium sp. J-068]